MILQEDIDVSNGIQGRTQTGLANLIKGTDKEFAVVFGDTGYEYIPHNGNFEDRITLKEYCEQVGAVFVAPPSTDADFIYQVNEDPTSVSFGLIEPTPTDNIEGLSSRKGNSKGVVGQGRKGVEQLHAAVKQDKIWRVPIHYKLIEPIGTLCEQLNLNPLMAFVPKVQVRVTQKRVLDY